jgi:hypothetical protein
MPEICHHSSNANENRHWSILCPQLGHKFHLLFLQNWNANIHYFLAEKSKGLFFTSACGLTLHETASALDLLTFHRLLCSIQKSTGKGAQTFALPHDHLGGHICHSNLQVPGIQVVAWHHLQKKAYNAYTTHLLDVVKFSYLKDLNDQKHIKMLHNVI